MLLLPSAFAALDASFLLRPFLEYGTHSLAIEPQMKPVSRSKLGDLFFSIFLVYRPNAFQLRLESGSASIRHASLVRFVSLAFPYPSTWLTRHRRGEESHWYWITPHCRQTDLTSFDCSASNSATQPLILAASCLWPFFSRMSASQRSIPTVIV